MKNEKGTITAYFAVMLPVLLLFIALGLDYGRAFVLKHELQSASDAASLAGVSATYDKLLTDGMGTVTGNKLVVEPALADGRAVDVWNQNLASLQLATKGVTIIDTSNHGALDSDSDGYLDSYKWGVTAKIKSFLAGPITGIGNDIVVTRLAISKVRD